VYNTIAIEDLNKPAMALCHEGFAIDAMSAASGRGMPGVRIVAETVPNECTVKEEIEVRISAAMDDIVAKLTQPLTEEEASPRPKETEGPSRIIFQENLEGVNRLFYKSGWTDGLPIIPPTEEAVEEMLTGTDLPADHLVGRIIPRSGKATVEKIAINAVMAGALPTHMPLLIAGVQAIMDPATHFGTFEVSTGSWSPFWIVNGPIRDNLNVNKGTGALSPGDIANAAIGRAMGLIIKNIGGARKGIEDMGVFGNPGKYTMVIAENEEESPWEPLHVEQGFNKEDNTISLFFPNCYSQIWPYGSDDKGILRSVISNVIPARRGLFCLMLIPSHARTLAEKGWTKKKVAEFISEYARVPAYRHQKYYGVGAVTWGLTKEQMSCVNPMDSMSILHDPDWIRILVAGGPGAFMGLLGGSWFPKADWITRKVEIPADWDNLVRKYKDLVPTYIRY